MIVPHPIPAVVKDPASANQLAHMKQLGLIGSSMYRTLYAPMLPGDYILNTQPTLKLNDTGSFVLEMHEVARLTPRCRLVLSEPFFVSGLNRPEDLLRPTPGNHDVEFSVPGDPRRFKAAFQNCVIDGCQFCMPQWCRYAAEA